MPYSDIIDNRKIKLKDEINALLSSSDEARFAVGYLYLSGFYQIAERLGELKEVKILTGNTLQKETIEELAQSLASEEELKDTVESERIQRKSESERIRDGVAEAITRNLQALPHTAA